MRRRSIAIVTPIALLAPACNGLLGNSDHAVATDASTFDAQGDRATDSPEGSMPRDGGGETSACKPGATRSVACGRCGTELEKCTSGGTWTTRGSCTAEGACLPGTTKGCTGGGTETCGKTCAWEACTTPPSCAASGAGVGSCSAVKESCCTSPEVTGGTFSRTYTNTGMGAVGEEDPASVSTFRLDRYAVTVGRFRRFVAAWKGGMGYTPPAGSGKHAHLNGGRGLANAASTGSYESGWIASDDVNVAPTDANLACDPSYATWTPTPEGNENLPIDCENWWEAYAFCIWDGGFLPSEAEWEYAAAGGAQEREYPWGSTDPGAASEYAIYGNSSTCYYPSGTLATCTGLENIAPVGFAAEGSGLWTQLDLVGDMWAWNLDLYDSTYVDPCTDCAYLPEATTGNRVLRGGHFNSPLAHLVPPYRFKADPTLRTYDPGIRCARIP